MPETTKYLAAAISPSTPQKGRTKKDVRANLEDWVERIDGIINMHAHYLPIKLVVFPEMQFSAPDMPYWGQKPPGEEAEAMGVEIPGEETDMLTQVCKKHDIYLVAGSAIEVDPKYPGFSFNTTAIIGPEGVLTKYRKVNTFIPGEPSLSPADLLPEYSEELWPVAKTPIGNLGVAICYDWIFPEATRSLTMNGAEILIRVSAYPQPWGSTPPMEWWTVVNRCRALENMAYVVAANIWPGQNQVIDWEGRIIVQSPAGADEQIALGPIDIDMVRWVRKTQLLHNMPCQLRTEAYPCYRKTYYPSGLGVRQCTGTGMEVHERQASTIMESRKKLWKLE